MKTLVPCVALGCALQPAALAYAPPAPRVPSAFIANAGQFAPGVRFQAACPDGLAAATADGFALVHRAGERAVALRFRFGTAARVNGVEPLATEYHFLREPGRSAAHVLAFERVRLEAVADGIDLALQLDRGALEYDLELAPGARFADLAVDCEGARSVRVDAETGELVIVTELSELRHSVPRTYVAAAGGERRPLAVRYVAFGGARFGFAGDAPSPGERAVLDPTVKWVASAGGSAHELDAAVAVDAAGAVYVSGETLSVDLPATPGAFDLTLGGARDGFVAKFGPNGGAPIWITYLGGSSGDSARAIALQPGAPGPGDVFVAGWTDSANFPVTAGALDPSYNGARDAFVARLAANGASLVWSTFLGGSEPEVVDPLTSDDRVKMGLAVAPDGAVVVASCTRSANFPVTAGAFDPSFNGASGASNDQFCARLAPAGTSLEFSTFFGGAASGFGGDTANDVAIRADGSVLCVGTSDSIDLPLSADSPAPADALGSSTLLRIPASGVGADAAWALPKVASVDTRSVAQGVALAADGTPFVATSEYLVSAPNGGSFGQVIRLTPDASGIADTFSSFTLLDVAVAPGGAVYACGHQSATSISNPAGVVAKLGTTGNPFDLLVLFKGNRPNSVAVDPSGDAVIGGNGDALNQVFVDVVASAIRFCAGSVDDLGGACPALPGLAAPEMYVTGCPVPGETLFVSIETLGPTGTGAFLLFGAGAGPTPVSATCSLSLSAIAPIVLPMTGPGGSPFLSGVVPAGTPPGAFFMQAVVADPGAISGLSATNAVRIVVAP